MRPTPRLLVSCLIIPSLLATVACGAEFTPPPANTGDITVLAAPGVPGGVISVTIKLHARVTAKDEAKRTLTLAGDDGKEQTLEIPVTAVNFPQVKVGDVVVATLTEETIAVVVHAGIPVAQGEALIAGLAKPGGKPAAAAAAVTQLRGTITAIDAQARTATIQGDGGKQRVLHVRDDIDLAKQHVGDQVVLRVTTAIALEVEAPKPAGK